MGIQNTTAIIIMASGQSVRMGQNKLLLNVGGDSCPSKSNGAYIGSYIIETAVRVSPGGVFLISCYQELLDIGKGLGAHCIYNTQSELGQSRSIVLGTEAIKAYERATGSEYEAAIFCPADQPMISERTLTGLDAVFRTKDAVGKIIAASYNGVTRSPVLFPRRFFAELSALTGDVGGKAVMRKYPGQVCTYEVVDADEGIDIDRFEDIGLVEERLCCRKANS